MALNPLDEIRNLGAPADLGGGAPMGGPPPDMGGGPPGMGGGPPIPGGPPMGGSLPIDPGVGAGALDFAMGAPPMGMPDMDMAAGGLGEPELGPEAGTDEAATQVAVAIVEMAPSPDEAMNLANAISEKVASMVMDEEVGAEVGAEDRLMELGLGMQFGGRVPNLPAGGGAPYGGYEQILAEPSIPYGQARQRGTLPQQFGEQSWLEGQGQGGSGQMGPPVGSRGGYRDGGGIGSLMMNRGGEPTMAGGRPIQWQQGPVGQRRRQDFMNYMAPRQARRQLGRQQAAGGPGRRAANIGPGGWQAGGELTHMASGDPIQWQQGPVGERRRRDYINYVAPGVARRQLARQQAAGGPGRRAANIGPGGWQGGGELVDPTPFYPSDIPGRPHPGTEVIRQRPPLQPQRPRRRGPGRRGRDV
jgi:hypothetical protein